MKKKSVLAILLSVAMLLPSCGMNNTGKGALIGGGGGAGLGALIGGLIGDGKGAAIGAGVGAAVGAGAGALIGRKMDKAAEQAREIEGAQVSQGEENGVQYVKVTLDSGITFPTNGTALSSTAKTSLNSFIGQLDPQFNIAVAGHTDNTGSLEVNQRISLQRAQSVANYLSSCGVSAGRLVSVKGYDYQYPVADNGTSAGRAQNRRVELYLLPSQAMIDEANAQAK
ncbi:MAG: OmpA family protein [Candidatus Limisoma sp.]